ncbi:hypothetical protein [Thiosulfativibrio zosterae]|uniref:Uncharacterized protein n=1 Tax=Thiosulfativibrio zosterae TaxID=2675053 RepID=A0A6F8PN45_9GAMM|nr:hypothetical protein [Thiosulfativibrio zosterae]BBP43529.1 hypothetical protein THMIRHAT_12750 [Thiosulfativibrio zosterae]
MDTLPYQERLTQLLIENYTLIKDGGMRKKSDPKIEGFMEAGLVLNVVNKTDLQAIINNAHKQVFGIPFSERIRPQNANDELLDIPTWMRDNKVMD